MAKDSSAAEVRLDVDAMSRHQVDQLLEAFAFATWVAHG